jgi:hypothetical protein
VDDNLSDTPAIFQYPIYHAIVTTVTDTWVGRANRR